MDKTRDSKNSKFWPDSTCAISVRRKGQILLVVESLVLSTTLTAEDSLFVSRAPSKDADEGQIMIFYKNNEPDL